MEGGRLKHEEVSGDNLKRVAEKYVLKIRINPVSQKMRVSGTKLRISLTIRNVQTVRVI
jgi:hypothetical protein